jgi:hypothetical protein
VEFESCETLEYYFVQVLRRLRGRTHQIFGLAKYLTLRAAVGRAARCRAGHTIFGLAKYLTLRAAVGRAARCRAGHTIFG